MQTNTLLVTAKHLDTEIPGQEVGIVIKYLIIKFNYFVLHKDYLCNITWRIKQVNAKFHLVKKGFCFLRNLTNILFVSNG